MRLMCVLLIVGTLGSSGCSALIIGSGPQLSDFPTKEKVRSSFGKPVEIGDDFEVYHSHRKFWDGWRAEGNLMVFVVTAGLSEIILCPQELFVAAKECVVGSTIQFTYDKDGTVIEAHFVNKEVNSSKNFQLKILEPIQ